MNKKAVSEVITTVLLVLLVLAAIGIFWFFIQPLIERTEETGSSTNCLTLDLEIVSAQYRIIPPTDGGGTPGFNEFIVSVKRNAGEGNLSDIKFFVDGSEKELQGVIPLLGETRNFGSTPPTTDGRYVGKQVTVAGVFGSITCPASEPKVIS